jgi:hypothetical protein
MDLLGVFLLILGAWAVVSTIASIVSNPAGGSVMVWFWRVIWLLGGGYVLYQGYLKVTAPPPGLLSAVPGMTGGRRKWY